MNILFKYLWFKIALALLIALVVGVAFVNAFIIATASDHIYEDITELDRAQAVMILGAGVYASGQLTPVLQDRVDTAISIYESGLVEKILVSGDNRIPEYNEVVPVRAYLLASGVPESDIFLDYAGFDTYDSMYRARAVFSVDSLVVVTQDFHLPRTVFLADYLGLDVQGYAAKRSQPSLMTSLREVLARVKAAGDVMLQSEPTFLGEQIPIERDGRETLGDS